MPSIRVTLVGSDIQARDSLFRGEPCELKVGLVLDLAGESVTIGRADGNDLQIQTSNIYRHQITLDPHADTYRLTWIQGRSKLNGNWSDEAQPLLVDGDTFRVGGIEFQYQA